MINKLADKVAVVTGGNSGIGLAVATDFANEGARVVITGRNRPTLDVAAANIPGEVLALEADVTNLDAIETVFTQTAETFGPVDVLFVNAGIARMAPLGDMTEALFDEVMNTNFKGAYFTIQKALPYLNDNASIILTGSVNARVGFAGASIYSASKAALHSLATTLSAELIGRGIRVNTLTIGPVETPLYSKLGMPEEAVQGFAAQVVSKLPVRRFGKPEEIARAAVFLASDDSSFVVGSEIVTDGGLLINSL